MSSKVRFLSYAAVAVFALVAISANALGDVTGTFGTHISLTPQTTVTELALIDFDVQNDLNVTVVISGLSTTFHSHFGIAGVEDIILSTNATLGALDIQAQLVFGRFSAICGFAFSSAPQNCLVIVNNPLPLNDSLLFIKKRVTTTLTLGGVVFSNLAIFEDTTYPETLAPTAYQTQNFAFGDVLTLSGQTPSGISIVAQTGICATRTPNVIKKHAFPFEVNPDCATTPKPDILFDFERLTISGVPLAPSITASATIACVTITACSLSTTIRVSGGPAPISATLLFTDLLSLSFGGASISLSSGAATLRIDITPTGAIGLVNISLSATLNPDTNPATLAISANATPGVGVTSAVVSLTIVRAGLTFGAEATFTAPGGVPPAVFDGLTFTLSVPGSLLSLESEATFTSAGLTSANIWLIVNF